MKNVTLFTCPKPFIDPHINLIQRNAIRSWMQFEDEVDIFLVGDEDGAAEVAREFGINHLPEVERNEWGTPRVDAIFSMTREASNNEIMAYLNADILLPPDFLTVVGSVDEGLDEYLLIGRRWDLIVEEEIKFDDQWMDQIMQQINSRGELHGPQAMDYFVFPRGLYSQIPPFAIGRAGWDNWMVYHAQQQGWAVLDATPSLTVIHQEHDYAHLPGGRPHYKLDESRHNVQLGGGFDKVYDLLDVDQQFRDGRIRKTPFTFPRFFRKLERWVMPPEKRGWRWRLARQFRRLRRKVS